MNRLCGNCQLFSPLLKTKLETLNNPQRFCPPSRGPFWGKEGEARFSRSRVPKQLVRHRRVWCFRLSLSFYCFLCQWVLWDKRTAVAKFLVLESYGAHGCHPLCNAMFGVLVLVPFTHCANKGCPKPSPSTRLTDMTWRYGADENTHPECQIS